MFNIKISILNTYVYHWRACFVFNVQDVTFYGGLGQHYAYSHFDAIFFRYLLIVYTH